VVYKHFNVPIIVHVKGKTKYKFVCKEQVIDNAIILLVLLMYLYASNPHTSITREYSEDSTTNLS
jgi:hypothetical protein